MFALGLLILRLAVGLTLAAHGAQKLFGWFEGPGIGGFAAGLEKMRIQPARPQAVLAGLSELGGGLLVAAGLLSPIGNFAAIGTMVVAIFTVHVANGFFNGKGGYEFPLLIAATMLGLAVTGPGAYSIDHLLGIRLPEPATAIVMIVLAAAGVAATLGSRQLGSRVTAARPTT